MNPWIPHLLRAGGGGGGAVLPPTGRTMLANLTSSLILDEGTGAPTGSRATKAWRFNERGYLEEIASGCAVFGGARLVRNLVPTPSNTLAIAGTKTVTLTQAATLQFSMGAGAGTATFSGTGGASGTLAAGASRVSVNKTVAAGTFIVTASVDALVDLSIVDVTNYDASYIPEYVSVGVEASPYFGAGIDGAKYFETDWQGAPIAAANLLGFRREASAINNLLFSRTLDGRFATASYSSSPKAWIPTTTGSELVTNGTFASDVSGWTADIATVTWSAGKMRVATAGGYGWATQVLSLTVGTTYVITASFSVIAGGISSIRIHPDATRTSVPIRLQNSETPSGTFAVIFTATAATQILSLQNDSNATIEYDDISVKEATMSVSPTATGLDGIANTATTLTATAADAIILQPISLASAARCASAYVKRRTGTGTISFTQDGGSTWTDITSQINSSTWSRVQIPSTLANPSVGFKISTSGDAIDVDCVQNEAGAVATSPIVTTTAAITRNGDSLTYQTAGNIDFAMGTAYCEAQLTSATSTRRAIYVGAVAASFIDGSTTVWKAYDGTNTVIKSGLSDISTAKRKRVISWGTGLKVSGDGLAPASGSFDGAFGSGASMEIGQNINGYIGPVAIYNYQMTDAELQALTT